jgi:hypothetical protein
VLSQFQGLNLDYFDRYVMIADTLDGSLNNVYLQLQKIAFKSLFDILDKISFFINDYLKLGIPDDKVNFSIIWYAAKDRKEIEPEIVNTRNPGLNALYDVHKDLDYGSYRVLKDTRNSLTHRFVAILENPKHETDRVMCEESLYKQTIDLARIVKNAIIYLLQFVRVEELKRTKVGGAIPIIIHSVPFEKKKRKTKRKNKKLA